MNCMPPQRRERVVERDGGTSVAASMAVLRRQEGKVRGWHHFCCQTGKAGKAMSYKELRPAQAQKVLPHHDTGVHAGSRCDGEATLGPREGKARGQ